MLIKAFAEQNSYGNAVQVFRYATDIFHKEFGMPFMNTNSKRVLENIWGHEYQIGIMFSQLFIKIFLNNLTNKVCSTMIYLSDLV